MSLALNVEDARAHASQSLPRRVWKAIVNEFTPPVMPRPSPPHKQLTEGHRAVGIINDVVEDGPGGDVQGADMLIIAADVPGHGTLHRRISCPLSTPGSGRELMGKSIGFRHTTFEPDFVNDILVTHWPAEVARALRQVRYGGPVSLRARIWSFLAGFGFVIMWVGVVLAPVLLCGILFGGDMFTGLPAWFHPGIALLASIGAVPLGLFLVVIGNARENAVR